MASKKLYIAYCSFLLLVSLLILNFLSPLTKPHKPMESYSHIKRWDSSVDNRVGKQGTGMRGLNGPQTAQDDPVLLDVVRRSYIHDPAPAHVPYQLTDPQHKDFSMGQSAIIDRLFRQKVSKSFNSINNINHMLQGNMTL